MNTNISFDTPEDEDVLQYDQESPVVPVSVENVVRTDEMPTITAYKTIVLRNDGGPEKLLNADPRRKRVILWITSMGADAGIFFGKLEDISGSRGGGAFLQAFTVPIRIEFCDKDEIWVRPGDNLDTAGNWSGWGVAGSGILVSLITENWAQ